MTCNLKTFTPFYVYVITILLSLASCGAQIENFQPISFYAKPEELIQNLEKKDKDSGQYFMLGQAYKEQKQFKKALLCFANSCFTSHRNEKLTLYPMPVYLHVSSSFHKKSPYYEDALYEIALIMHSYQEHAHVEKFLKRIGKTNYGLYIDAQVLLSRALQAQKEGSKALAVLSNGLAGAPNTATKLKLLIRRASLYENLNNYDKAAGDYISIMEQGEKSWQAGLAASQLYQIVYGNRGGSKISLAPKDALTLAKSLYFAKKNKDAQNVLTSLKKQTKIDKNAVNEYLLRVQLRLGLDKDASETSKGLPNAQSITADELWLLGKRDRAVQIYTDMIKKGHRDEQSMYRTAMFMHDRTRAGYDSFMELYIKNFPKTENAGQILWLLARMHLKNDKTNEAEKLLLQYLEKFPEGKYNDQCYFWLGKIYAKNGKRDLEQKLAFRLAAVNPDSPYLFLVLERAAENMKAGDILRLFNNAAKNSDEHFYYHCLLTIKEKSMKKRDERIPMLGGAIQSDIKKVKTSMQNAASGKYNTKQLQNLEKYARIGYTEGIERVLTALPNTETANIERAAILAYLGGKFSNPFYSSFHGQQLLKNLSLKENIFILPKIFISLILPRPFADAVKINSERYGIEADIIYAVMKAESMFQHKAKSSAGALGLMQLMPGTAKEIARNSKIAEYDMNKPEDNIRFGAHYLGWLKRYYKNDFIYMAAGYNAGPGNANRWLKQKEYQDQDYFTEFATFRETRYYILRTGKFLRQYSITNGP